MVGDDPPIEPPAKEQRRVKCRLKPDPAQFALIDLLFLICAFGVLAGWWAFVVRDDRLPDFVTAEDSYAWIRVKHYREHINRGVLFAFIMATYFFGCYRWPRLTAGLLIFVLGLPVVGLLLLLLFAF